MGVCVCSKEHEGYNGCQKYILRYGGKERERCLDIEQQTVRQWKVIKVHILETGWPLIINKWTKTGRHTLARAYTHTRRVQMGGTNQ